MKLKKKDLVNLIVEVIEEAKDLQSKIQNTGIPSSDAKYLQKLMEKLGAHSVYSKKDFIKWRNKYRGGEIAVFYHRDKITNIPEQPKKYQRLRGKPGFTVEYLAKNRNVVSIGAKLSDAINDISKFIKNHIES